MSLLLLLILSVNFTSFFNTDTTHGDHDTSITPQKHNKKWGKVQAAVHIGGMTEHHELGFEDEGIGIVKTSVGSSKQPNEHRKTVVTHHKPTDVGNTNNKIDSSTENQNESVHKRSKNRRQSV